MSAMISVEARGASYRIGQVLGNLFVCSRQSGGCCCGHIEKGRAPVNQGLYQALWESRRLRNKVHLTFVACLGPCQVGNNAMLTMFGQNVWFKDLNDDRHIVQLFDYIAEIALAKHVVPASGELAGHVFERYEDVAAGTTDVAARDWTGLDPVCMMTVDPVTAQWRSIHNGAEYCFCAPGCKRAFDADPVAYIGGELVPPTAPAAFSDQVATHESRWIAPDISCDMCVKTISRALAKVQGVASISVDQNAKRVIVAWSTPASEQLIAQRMAESGYPPVAETTSTQ